MLSAFAKMLGIKAEDAEEALRSERAARHVLTRRAFLGSSAAMVVGTGFSFGAEAPAPLTGAAGTAGLVGAFGPVGCTGSIANFSEAQRRLFMQVMTGASLFFGVRGSVETR